MSSSGEKRNRAMAMRAASLKAEGSTSRQIAEAIGKRPEQVAALVLMGERLKQEDDPLKLKGAAA